MPGPSRPDHQLSGRSSVRTGVDGRSDAELIALVRAGQSRAFDVIVARYAPVLHQVALRVLRDRDEARDVVQTTFARAWDHLESYDSSRKLFSWLYRIAVNCAMNERAKRRVTECIDDLTLVSPRATPDEELARLEQRSALERALARLPEPYRQVVLLRHFGDLDYEEIAAALDLDAKTVKSRLFTARRRLAELLNGKEREAWA